MHTRNWTVKYHMMSNQDIYKSKGKKSSSLREVKTMLALDRMPTNKPKIEKINLKEALKENDNS